MVEISYQCRSCKHVWRTDQFVVMCPSCGIRFGGDPPAYAEAHHANGIEEPVRPLWSVEYVGHTVTVHLDAEMPTWAVLYCQQLFSEQMPKHSVPWYHEDAVVHLEALGRHIQAVARGEIVDPDSGRLIMAHIALRALMALEMHAHAVGQNNPIKAGKN